MPGLTIPSSSVFTHTSGEPFFGWRGNLRSPVLLYGEGGQRDVSRGVSHTVPHQHTAGKRGNRWPWHATPISVSPHTAPVNKSPQKPCLFPIFFSRKACFASSAGAGNCIVLWSGVGVLFLGEMLVWELGWWVMFHYGVYMLLHKRCLPCFG